MRSRDRDMELALAMPHLRAVPTDGATAPPPETPDAELLALVAERDRAAFDLLYHRYVRSVFGLALRRLGDRGRAEDAVQEAFAAIWRSAASYKPERGNAAGWLYTVARNAIVDRFRTAGAPVIAEVPDLAADEPGPAERAEASFVAWRIHRALEELPRREREVVELAYWSGMSQSEVAEYLHLPLGTVKTRTRSALARLSGLLEGELG
ncbi:MAG TPA: sigma-70 family RNA polymerase sigma factor [Gaiellaceae bacterium]|nr:sigma-70 family RNA polymerase sigma factor [Gaiellaceae bacterium]